MITHFALALLAENVEGFASEADRSEHLHVDYFPGHDYLAQESDSLVVAIDADVHRNPLGTTYLKA
jgi:hypothetical protein